MTDARLRGSWLFDPRFDRLSDRAFRTYCNSLMYGAEQGTDGALEPRSLRWLHPDGVSTAVADELVTAGLWQSDGHDGFVVTEWERTQTSHAQIEARRQQNRENQRRSREKRKKAPNGPQTASVSSDSPADVSAAVNADDVGQDRTGQDRTDTRPSAQPQDLSKQAQDPWCRDVAGARGVTDFDQIHELLRRELGHPLSDADALRAVTWILDRARERVRDPQKYVVGSIRRSWAEIQRELDLHDDAA